MQHVRSFVCELASAIPVAESPLDFAFAQGVGMSTYVTGALLMGQMAHEPYTLEGYIISSGWMFFCFIMGASFTAELASFLSAQEETVLVSNVGAMAHTCTQALPKTSLRYYSLDVLACHPRKRCAFVSCTINTWTRVPGSLLNVVGYLSES